MKDILIRNIPEEVVAKMDDNRKKSHRSLSREAYCRMLLEQHTLSTDLQDLDRKYLEITKAAVIAIEKNNHLLMQITSALNIEEGKF